MKTLFAIVVAAAAIGAPAPASAQQPGSGPTISARPAATLLLPYFEVATGEPTSLNTIFTVTNTSETAILTNVTIWSEFSVPVYNFNLYFTGYDTQVINMRDVLSGLIPQTASFGQDFGPPFISPQGPLSDDDDFASCSGVLPPANLTAAQAEGLQKALTGQSSSLFGGMCVARPQVGGPADKVARGYVTVDTMSLCTPGENPSTPGYFAKTTDQNVLVGDFTLLNLNRDQAQGDNLVHITASTSDPDTSVPGQYTFYGRYVNWDTSDHREPLATVFGARFMNGSFLGTQLLVWRDSKVVQTAAVVCGSTPPWVPLGQTEIVAFNEQEDADTLGGTPFPVQTQKVPVNTLGTSFQFGWLYLDLNHSNVTVAAIPTEPDGAQAWVVSLFGAERKPGAGRFSAGVPALLLGSARTTAPPVNGDAAAVTGGRR